LSSKEISPFMIDFLPERQKAYGVYPAWNRVKKLMEPTRRGTAGETLGVTQNPEESKKSRRARSPPRSGHRL